MNGKHNSSLDFFRPLDISTTYLPPPLEEGCTGDCRSRDGQYIAACRVKLREQSARLKLYKRELRQTQRTMQTYELLARKDRLEFQGAVGLGTIQSGCQPTAQLGLTKYDAKDATILNDTLAKTMKECETLRTERKELQGQIQQITASLDRLRESKC